MSQSRAARRHRNNLPWGRYIGLLTAAMVMLSGIIVGLEPFLILQRALLSGLAIGMMVGFGVGLVQLLDADRSNRRAR